MLGAIIGDIIGSPYEFDEYNIKTTDFPLFSEESEITDDTIMTLAVAQGLMNGAKDPQKTYVEITNQLQKLGKEYPYMSYGCNFQSWLQSNNPQPYSSYGNGSAMRVSSVAWFFDNLDDVEKFAEISALPTHNHPEGIKGAQAVASAIFLARSGKTKSEIRNYIIKKYNYDLSKTCDEIRPTYHHIESCQETVPQAIIAFLDGNSFEEVIRLSVSLGGDSDTLTAIAGSIAEAYYPIPYEIKEKALKFLDDDLLEIFNKFSVYYSK
ncbi:ADP-ribosylglycohydrolase family protein [bacterium]|nr:ADP-ribosylglycohydrolase family protein [bacterium]